MTERIPEGRPRPDGVSEYQANQPFLLDNATCPYCGEPVEKGAKSDKEHVVGRKFVPKGTLNGAWNLILRACRRCNGEKSDLENDLSVITMHPDVGGRFATDDTRHHEEVRRKAGRAISRRTKKPVSAGEDPVIVRTSFGPMQMTFTMQMPPQAEEDRLFRLARLQLQAVFYFLTYDRQTRRGAYWPGSFCPLVCVRRQDWGNPHLRWLEAETADWALRFFAITADGFYKILVRRKLDADLWAWAIEWNQNFRLAGFFGDEVVARSLAVALPPLDINTVHERASESLRMRIEAPLAEGEDRLFAPVGDDPQNLI